MKLSKKLIAPIVTIGVMGAISVGTTYALFTSDAKTDITVTSGKVNVTSTISELKTYSGIDLVGDPTVDVNYTDDLGGAFSNGGSASIDGNVLTIDNMTPGDKLQFKLTNKNNGNVSTKWRYGYKVTSDNGLANNLTITVDTNSARVSKLRTNSDWMVAGTAETKEHVVTIEFPSDKGNELQEKQCSITFFLDAVQGNAYVKNINLEIQNKEELLLFRNDVNSGFDFDSSVIGLMNDIDLAGETWTTIGNGINPFKAVFDGNDNEINNFTISSTQEYTGLFGVIDGGSVINLDLNNVNVSSTKNDTGAVVGRILHGGTLDNVNVLSGTVSGVKRTGGLVGSIKAEGTIKNSTNKATITSTNYNIGGIVGAAYYVEAGKDMLIENCKNEGTVTGPASNVGGITGLSTATIKDCVNKAAITSNGTSTGGIVGEQKMIGSVTGCVNEGLVINNSNGYGTGGIIGWVRYPDPIGADYAASGLITVSGNKNTANVKGGNDAGGIVGTVYNSAIVKNNTNLNETNTAVTFAAGIVGNYQKNETPALPELKNNFVIEDNTINQNTVNTAQHTDPICYKN